MIPTEPIGSLPRPPELVAAIAAGAPPERLDPLCEDAIRVAVEALEATGSPVVTDGEQGKIAGFWCDPVYGAANVSLDGFPIPLSNGRGHRMPRLLRGPLRFERYGDRYLRVARRHASVPVKQAIISPSALSLMYPPEGLPGYPREQFLDDLLREHETDIRRCLEAGAHRVQVDFTEARLAMQLDPTGALLASFIDLNNMALSRFSGEERALLGVYVCPGAPGASTIDYAELLPSLMALRVGNVYVALAGEADPCDALRLLRAHLRPDQRVFVGVTVPHDPHVETPEEVRDRVLLAAEFIPAAQLGTTDDCGFAPFCDTPAASLDAALAKIRARVAGTRLAASILEGRR